MTQTRALLRITKGIYDILATYVLGWILVFALLAAGLHVFFNALEDLAPALTFKINAPGLRLLAYVLLHTAILYALRRPLALAQGGAERVFDAVSGAVQKVTRYVPALDSLISVLFTCFITAMLIPFVIQPTMVTGFDRQSWLERAGNLLDGTASIYLADSVVGFYRRLYAEPVVEDSLTPDEATQVFGTLGDPYVVPTTDPLLPPPMEGDQPMMDRWNAHLWSAAEGDPRIFATLKAFMWVESAGRQYAVSTTGCSGLMQFCAGTARSQPYRNVFGTGQVYACRCEGPCRIERSTQRRMESGELAGLQSRSPEFPCELTDARFNPTRSIAAARLYIDRLDAAYGGNLYLMYIGYNSGPGVANKVFNDLGRDPNASLEMINVHLAGAMRPHYGAASEARARSLVNIHLPKLRGAYDKYATEINAVAMASVGG